MTLLDFDVATQRIGVLIPTRNRPEKIRKLLLSLSNSKIKLKDIVIVSSGDDISDVVKEYSSTMRIKHEHSQLYGQVNQKKIGIALLDNDLDWVVFLDDDLLVSPDCVGNALEEVVKFEDSSGQKVTGVGLSLPPTSRSTNSNRILRLIGSIFLISNSKPGKISRSGHAASYLESNVTLTTQWLNGASMWRRESIDCYGKNIVSTKYAACEDLIFSYSQFQGSNLIYVPTALVNFQENEVTNFENRLVFKTAALWRLYFVMSNKEFSRLLFLYSQIGRTLFGVLKTESSRLRFFLSGIVLWFKLVILSMSKTRLEKALKSV